MNSLTLLNDLLRKLYIEDPATLNGTILAGLKDDCLSAINRTYQVIWTAPEEHFRRQQFDFLTVSGTNEYLLDQSIQELEGLVKVNGSEVRPISDRGDFDNYGIRFKGALSNSIPQSVPEAYFLQSFGQNAADSVELKMLFTPTPDAEYSVTFEASSEAPRITLVDIDNEVDLFVPGKYVESIFLPISRFFIQESHFYMADKRQAETQKAQSSFVMAMKQLGYTDPQIEQYKKGVS